MRETAGAPGDGGVGDRCLAAPQPGDGVADLVQFLLGGAAAGLVRGGGAIRGHAVASSWPCLPGSPPGVAFVVAGLARSVARNDGVPDAVEVVLGPAQVQGKGLVEQAEPGEGLLQPVDRVGGGREDLVQVVGGGVVGGALGDGVPLLALAPPVEQVGAGQDELVAVWQSRFHGQAPPSTTGWKVQNPPSAGVLRRDRSIASACACRRSSGAAGPDSSSPGLGGAGSGDPDVLEDVFQVGWATLA